MQKLLLTFLIFFSFVQPAKAQEVSLSKPQTIDLINHIVPNAVLDKKLQTHFSVENATLVIKPFQLRPKGARLNLLHVFMVRLIPEDSGTKEKKYALHLWMKQKSFSTPLLIQISTEEKANQLQKLFAHLIELVKAE